MCWAEYILWAIANRHKRHATASAQDDEVWWAIYQQISKEWTFLSGLSWQWLPSQLTGHYRWGGQCIMLVGTIMQRSSVAWNCNTLGLLSSCHPHVFLSLLDLLSMIVLCWDTKNRQSFGSPLALRLLYLIIEWKGAENLEVMNYCTLVPDEGWSSEC